MHFKRQLRTIMRLPVRTQFTKGTSWAAKGGGRATKPKDTSGGVLGVSSGTIARVGPKFGFIISEDHGEVFVLADELKSYKPGQVVRFTAFIDNENKVQAMGLKSCLGDASTKRIGGGQRIPKETPGGVLGESIGTIERRGPKFGFIQSEEHGTVFVLADELKNYQQGHVVKFTAFIDEENQVQAKDLKSGLKTSSTKQMDRRWDSGIQRIHGHPKPKALAKNKNKEAPGGILGKSVGTIERTGPKFGFIQSNEHGTVFVLADELKNHQQGHVVEFTAFLDHEGKVSAKDLKSGLRDSYIKRRNGSQDLGSQSFHGQCKPKETPGGVLGESCGIISRRGPKFGFIESEEHGTVFVLADELKDFQKGHAVKFTAFVDHEDKVQAKDLKLGRTVHASDQAGSQWTGQSFNSLRRQRDTSSGVLNATPKCSSGKPSSYRGKATPCGTCKPKDTSGGVLGESIGTIERRGPKFGFIESEEHGTVFVLADELRNYQAGQVVKFTAFIDEQLSIQAMDLTPDLE